MAMVIPMGKFRGPHTEGRKSDTVPGTGERKLFSPPTKAKLRQHQQPNTNYLQTHRLSRSHRNNQAYNTYPANRLEHPTPSHPSNQRLQSQSDQPGKMSDQSRTTSPGSSMSRSSGSENTLVAISSSQSDESSQRSASGTSSSESNDDDEDVTYFTEVHIPEGITSRMLPLSDEQLASLRRQIRRLRIRAVRDGEGLRNIWPRVHIIISPEQVLHLAPCLESPEPEVEDFETMYGDLDPDHELDNSGDDESDRASEDLFGDRAAEIYVDREATQSNDTVDTTGQEMGNVEAGYPEAEDFRDEKEAEEEGGNDNTGNSEPGRAIEGREKGKRGCEVSEEDTDEAGRSSPKKLRLV
ncbi:hypothetical protein V8F20_010690 [Naviculisporaceae sp. PSN 640]